MTPSKTARRRWWWLLWTLLALGAIASAAYSVLPYLPPRPEASRIPLNVDFDSHYTSLVIHGLPGILALIIGPFQFVTRLRLRFPKAHRIAGRVYMGSIVIAAVAALFAATFSISGFPAQVAFYVMSLAWLYTLVQAYRTIRRGEVQLHRIWMIRNYALTFAAVSLRVYIVVGEALLMSAYPSLTFEDVYLVAVWGSFLVNVLVSEYFIVNRTLKPLARRHRTAPVAV